MRDWTGFGHCPYFQAALLIVFLGMSAADQQNVVHAQTKATQAAYSSERTQAASHPLDPALEMARASLVRSQQTIADYQALFIKRCRVDGVLQEPQYANVKIRNRKIVNGKLATPMGVYLGFLKPDSVKGREVIWVEGANEGKLIAHESGLKGFINVYLDPNSYLAMRGLRRPLTDIGIENLIVLMIESAMSDRRYQECDVELRRNAKVNDRTCTMIQVTHPVKRDHFDFHRAQVFFDDELGIPIRYASWSWPDRPGGQPVLEEEYTYLNVELNVGLSDADFDIANPSYQFR